MNLQISPLEHNQWSQPQTVCRNSQLQLGEEKLKKRENQTHVIPRDTDVHVNFTATNLSGVQNRLL